MRFSIFLLAAGVDFAAAAASYSTDELESIGQAIHRCGQGIQDWNGSPLSATFVLADCQNVSPVVNKAIQDTKALQDNTPAPDNALVDRGFEIAAKIVEEVEIYANDAIQKKQQILRLPIVGRPTALRMVESYKAAAQGAIDLLLGLAGNRRNEEAHGLEARLLAALEKADAEYRK
ncbi:hypothetical protein B0I35DRAFT_434297 [Stachybotrys elegans]|uniref:NACHT-NTPase and P-loop NTPases N-terminal domain-containing protein n=1 Tax=Stachybotrys elegans TaxID=80388 RepID=A0A8K0STN7_9HYPO|nr:hypothetical protein B0I35DRAFT_434297 [Stachybotrys elegans]